MYPYWLMIAAVGLFVAALANRNRTHIGWRLLMIACGVALIAGGSLALRHQWVHDHKLAQINAEEASIQQRLDALKAETASNPNPTDPNVAKSRRERLEQLQKDLDTVRKEYSEFRGSAVK